MACTLRDVDLDPVAGEDRVQQVLVMVRNNYDEEEDKGEKESEQDHRLLAYCIQVAVRYWHMLAEAFVQNWT